MRRFKWGFVCGLVTLWNLPLIGEALTSSPSEVLRKLPIGRVLSYEGEAYVNGVRVESQVPIFLGSSMSTKGGSLHMAFGRETLINLSNNSEFQVVQLAPRKDSKFIGIAGMLNVGKIQGSTLINKDGAHLPISILSPKGELIVRGGRFSVEVPADREDTIKFLSLDKASQLALFAPRELIDEHPLLAFPNEQDAGSLGIGLVSNQEAPDPIKEHRTLNLEPMQVTQIDFSSGFGSLGTVSVTAKEAIREYNSNVSMPFQDGRIFLKIDRISTEKFKNMETLNLTPNFDQVVISNFSNVMLTLDL